jgi:fatty-acid desaturase
MQWVAKENQTVFVKKNLIQVVAVHGITLGIAPFLYTPGALQLALGATAVFGYSMGIFHHMYLTHSSFRAHPWVAKLGSLLGTLTWRGPFAAPIRYVAMHRIHHRYSDTELDPHTPTKGLFHSLLGWFWRMPYGFTRPEIYERVATKIARDGWLRFLDRNVDLLQLGWGLLCFAAGALTPWLGGGSMDWVNGVRFAVYGVFVKTFLLIYGSNAVDVINHGLGYRNYETNELSTNSFLMAAIHLGGAISWHNNHHAHPRYFSVKRKWWEFDVHLLFLRGLERLSLVSDIKILDESTERA